MTDPWEEARIKYIQRLVKALNGRGFPKFRIANDDPYRVTFHLQGYADRDARYDHGTFAFNVRPYLYQGQRYSLEVPHEVDGLSDVWPHAWYEPFEHWPEVKIQEAWPIAEAVLTVLADFLPMYVFMIGVMHERERVGYKKRLRAPVHDEVSEESTVAH